MIIQPMIKPRNINMKTFEANTEERYVWNCPYCGDLCDSVCEDPAEEESIFCEHCGKEAKCERTVR
jgi:hypothetical protein